MNKSFISTAIKLMITIVDRGKRDKVIKIYNEEHIDFHFLCFGLGTASSELLDYLGIGETKKDVILSLVPDIKVDEMQKTLAKKLSLTSAGKGIVFTLPLSGLSGPVSHAICEECEVTEKGAKEMESNRAYDLILAVVNHGYTDQVMDAAKSVGATGGTVLHARGIGHEESEKFLGISIQSEKEIVSILVKKEDKAKVMQEIAAIAGLKTEAKGILLSLPVDSIIGLAD